MPGSSSALTAILERLIEKTEKKHPEFKELKKPPKEKKPKKGGKKKCSISSTSGTVH